MSFRNDMKGIFLLRCLAFGQIREHLRAHSANRDEVTPDQQSDVNQQPVTIDSSSVTACLSCSVEALLFNARGFHKCHSVVISLYGNKLAVDVYALGITKGDNEDKRFLIFAIGRKKIPKRGTG